MVMSAPAERLFNGANGKGPLRTAFEHGLEIGARPLRFQPGGFGRFGYATIGIAAPIIVTAARLLQGFSVGGEFGSAVAFLVEHGGERKGLSASMAVRSMLRALSMSRKCPADVPNVPCPMSHIPSLKERAAERARARAHTHYG